MTKADIIKDIALKIGQDNKDVSAIVESFLIVMKDSMAEGNDVFIRGFGSFINKKRAKKIARNITKNTSIVIPEHYIPLFKPSPVFKEMIRTSNRLSL
jgi:DNA-binding protein HU-beta